MGKIITLKDKITQESTYPITVPKAIITEDGKTLEDSINQFLERSQKTLDEAIQKSIVAENAIKDLKNLPENVSDIITYLQETIEQNKVTITQLETNYKNLSTKLSQLINKSDLTNNLKGEVGKIPTGIAVRNYMSDTALGIVDSLIKSTNRTPDYLPTNIGQILINETSGEVFIASPFSGSWIKINATPMILENEVLDVIIDGDVLQITGNTSVIDDSTIVIPDTEKVKDDILLFDPILSIEDNALDIKYGNTVVRNNTMISRDVEKVENNTLIF